MATLAKSISNSDTTLSFVGNTNFPQDDGVIQIGSETIIYKTIYMDTMYGCTRGARSTSAASHTIGDTISLVDFFEDTSSGGGGASTDLSNLASVAVNASLTPATDGTIDLDSLTNRYKDAYFSGDIWLDNFKHIYFGNDGVQDVSLRYDFNLGFLILDNTTAQFSGQLSGAGLFLAESPATQSVVWLRNNQTIEVYANYPNKTFIVTGSGIEMQNSFPVYTVETSSDVATDGQTITLNSSGNVRFRANAHADNQMQLDTSVTAGETRMLLFDVDSGSLQRVTVGDPDSGGIGFKVLRIPN